MPHDAPTPPPPLLSIPHLPPPPPPPLRQPGAEDNPMPHDPPPPTPPLLSIEQLSIPLPPGAARPYAVEDITLQLQRGEILCIVGESGSGKSMSANAIMGLLPPGIAAQGGRILFQGRDLL